MANSCSRGILVAVEGIDGAGKTTQVGLLAQSLKAAGEDPIVSKEPTGGFWGQKIRASATNGRLSLEEELRIFINDRTEHVQTVIQPALTAGKIVILDRYFYSTIAYQGSRGANVSTLTAEMEKRFPVPNAVFLLDLEPTVAVARIRNSRKETPNEFERVEALERVRDVFNALVGPVLRIDGGMPIEVVHRLIMESFVHDALESKASTEERARDQPLNHIDGAIDRGDWRYLSRLLLSEIRTKGSVTVGNS